MKKVSFTQQREFDGLLWTAQILDFGTSLCIRVATNEMNYCYAILKDDKRLFKQQVKKYANNALSLADKKEITLKSIMTHRKFHDDYSDTITDAARNDVTMYQLAVFRLFEDAGIAHAELFSHIETARTLLEIAHLHYKSTIELAEARFLRCYNKEFREFDFLDVYQAWGLLCDALYPRKSLDMNTPSVKSCSNILCKKFGSGDYINKCMKVACEENPEFDYNEIIISQE